MDQICVYPPKIRGGREGGGVAEVEAYLSLLFSEFMSRSRLVVVLLFLSCCYWHHGHHCWLAAWEIVIIIINKYMKYIIGLHNAQWMMVFVFISAALGSI